MNGSVVMTIVLNDIMYAMAYLIALMEGMNSIVVSDVVISSQACEPSVYRSPVAMDLTKLNAILHNNIIIIITMQ